MVLVRWSMGPTDSSVTYPGWNIDDIELTGQFDDLDVFPEDGWQSSGYEGGPFSPEGQEYVLTNMGGAALDWQATTDAGWVTLTPESGVLLPGESLPVGVELNGQANALPPGNYVADVAFVNLNSGMSFPRPVTLQVIARPGDCQVRDSILPDDDRQMPFGEVIVGMERREQVTITNEDPTYSLLVEEISLGGGYTEDFNDGQAQGWSEDVDASWEVVDGRYRAYSSMVDWMFSRYLGEQWEDLSASVVLERTGNMDYSHALVLRCTPDFDEGIGSAYIFQITTGGSYGIWKQVNGSWSWIQSWTSSAAINPSGANLIMATVQGSHLQFVINGVLVWDGFDTDLAGGHLGLGGHSGGGSTFFFDDVMVSDPVTVGLPVNPEQQWYNEHPIKGDDPRVAPDEKAPEYPGGTDAPGVIAVPRRLSNDAFRLENLPALPVVIGPGDSVVVDVVFSPEVPYEPCEQELVIVSNDADEPDIQLALSGMGVEDPLEVDCAGGMAFSGHEGGPFVPTDYTLSLTNQGGQNLPWSVEGPDWVSLSPAAGTLAPGQTAQVTVGLTELAAELPVGDYLGALAVTDHTTGLVQECEVALHVVQSPKVWVDPESLTITASQGGIYTTGIILGNDGDGDLNFTLSSREIPCGPLARTPVVEGGSHSAGAMAWEYLFTAPELKKTAEGYSEVSLAGLENYIRVGAPVLPLRPVQLLIPAGKKVVEVRAVPVGNLVSVDCPAPLAPGQKPYPLNQPQKVQKTLPDARIYALNSAWPNHYLTEWTCQTKRGYQYLTTGILPVQYIPAQGKLLFAERVRLEVVLAPSDKPVRVQATPLQKRQIKASVDNPKALLSYPLRNSPVAALDGVSKLPAGGPYHYVVITTEALASAPGPWNFQALCDARTANGLPATIVTTEYIYANYSGTRPDGGSDNQTRLRNFVMDAYDTWGTQYVLLAGDYTLVPPRQFYVDSYAGVADLMPADMYYGCVDPAACTFDYNANGYYGEPWDGVGGGEVDLMAEVYVGRAPVANASEVAHFVSKTLWYNQCTDEEFLARIAMLGEHLGFGGASEYATGMMEQIRLGGFYDGYFTDGFENTPLDCIDFITEGCLPGQPDCCWPLYDAPGYSWPKSKLLCLMNGGVHVFNHLGHANETYCMKLYTSDISSLVNDQYFFAYSQGCYSGCFDYPNCFAETLVTTAHGAFASIMNARYGWGTYNSTDGPSQRFDRQFWDASLGEGLFEYGVANQDSKEDNLYDLFGPCIRWCLYELNLFGDPAQDFKCSTGCPWLSLDPTHGSVPPGGQTPIEVIVDATALALGHFCAEIYVASNDPEVPLITIPVDLTVRVEPLQVLPEEPLALQGVRGGPFEPVEPGTDYYHLTNMDVIPLPWEVTASETWFAFPQSSGTLAPGESIDLPYVVTPEACTLPNGVHHCGLVFRNTASQAHFDREVILTVSPPDYYTELFSANDNDLDNTAFVFTPDGSGNFYQVCRFAADGLPTDPAGGVVLALGDDGYQQVILAGASVSFYGDVYDRFFVGSNGYLTFGTGDIAYGESFSQHFKYRRLSALFDDLSPNTGGQVSWKQLGDRVAVTYWQVPELRKANQNTFQVELFYDGVVTLTYLQIDAADGLVGLSRGAGVPADFAEGDFSGYQACMPGDCYPPDNAVNLADLAFFAEHWLADDCSAGNLHCQRMDVNADGRINLHDLAPLAGHWLEGN